MTGNECLMAPDEQIARLIDTDVRQAVRALANAAATAHIGRDPKNDEHQLWFLVRALCHEHGMDLAGVIERATNVAQERMERLQSD